MTNTLFTDHVPAGTHAGRPAASSVPTGTLYACSDHHLVYQSDGTAWSTWYDPGAAAANTIKDRRWVASSSETPVDEFNDSNLDAAWVRVDGNTARTAAATFTESGDVLSAYCDGGDATGELHALMRPLGTPLAVGDAISTCITLTDSPGSTSVALLVLADGVTAGAGAQQASLLWHDASTPLHQAVFNFTNYSANSGATTAVDVTGRAQLFTRLVKISATQIRHDFSGDGISWVKGGTATLTMTPAYVGVAVSSWGSTKKFAASFEFLRRVAGVS